MGEVRSSNLLSSSFSLFHSNVQKLWLLFSEGNVIVTSILSSKRPPPKFWFKPKRKVEYTGVAEAKRRYTKRQDEPKTVAGYTTTFGQFHEVFKDWLKQSMRKKDKILKELRENEKVCCLSEAKQKVKQREILKKLTEHSQKLGRYEK